MVHCRGAKKVPGDLTAGQRQRVTVHQEEEQLLLALGEDGPKLAAAAQFACYRGDGPLAETHLHVMPSANG